MRSRRLPLPGDVDHRGGERVSLIEAFLEMLPLVKVGHIREYPETYRQVLLGLSRLQSLHTWVPAESLAPIAKAESKLKERLAQALEGNENERF